MDPIYLNGPTASTPYEQIEIDDDEEDQLDSDLDDKDEDEQLEPDVEEDEEDDDELHEEGLVGPGHSPSANGRRKYHRKSGERVPGQTLLPHTRLENILRADGESGPMSKEALFVLSIATEEFIKQLSRAGHRQASTSKRSTINYRDMASAVTRHREFSFLDDIIPSPLPLKQALERRALKEKELVDEDPALSAPPAPSPLPDPSLPAITLPLSASATSSQAPTPSSNSMSADALPRPKPARAKRRRPTNGADGAQPPLTTATADDSADPSQTPPLANGAADPSQSALANAASERRRDARARDSRGRYSHGAHSDSTHSSGTRRSSRHSEPRTWTDLAHPAPQPPAGFSPLPHEHPAPAPAPMYVPPSASAPMPAHVHAHSASPVDAPAHGLVVGWNGPVDAQAPRTHSQPPWPGALAGPASAYLEERARSAAPSAGSGEGPFGQTGRTIYSQR